MFRPGSDGQMLDDQPEENDDGGETERGALVFEVGRGGGSVKSQSAESSASEGISKVYCESLSLPASLSGSAMTWESALDCDLVVDAACLVLLNVCDRPSSTARAAPSSEVDRSDACFFAFVGVEEGTGVVPVFLLLFVLFVGSVGETVPDGLVVEGAVVAVEEELCLAIGGVVCGFRLSVLSLDCCSWSESRTNRLGVAQPTVGGRIGDTSRGEGGP